MKSFSIGLTLNLIFPALILLAQVEDLAFSNLKSFIIVIFETSFSLSRLLMHFYCKEVSKEEFFKIEQVTFDAKV